jgi:hypothetical protein
MFFPKNKKSPAGFHRQGIEFLRFWLPYGENLKAEHTTTTNLRVKLRIVVELWFICISSP